MQKNNLDILNQFDLTSLPSLDTVVLGALELLVDYELPKVDLTDFKRPLVVGSGNAEATGRIIFAATDAVFASESDFKDKLDNISDIDEVVLVSASGGKHAPLIARQAATAGKHITLVTNTPKSPASRAVTSAQLHEYVFPNNREPYTYNTSTYLSMIMGQTSEDAAAIKSFIETVIDRLNWPDFAKHDKYYLIVPPQFSGIIRMLEVKFIELFGRNIARDIETSEYVRHATTVAPSNELFIAFGQPNETWGAPENRFNIPLPPAADYGAMMAVGYYVIAQIQKAQPQYFKDNIASYCQFISGIFGEDIRPIVESSK